MMQTDVTIDLFAREDDVMTVEALPDATAAFNTYGTASTFGCASSSTKGSAATAGSMGG